MVPEIPNEVPVIESLVRTGTGAFKAELIAAVAKPAVEAGEVLVEGFGVWKPEKMRESAAPSIVLMGVDLDLSEEQITKGLIVGSKGLVPDGDRGRLGNLRVKRLLSAPKDASTEARPTRQVRVYCATDMMETFLRLGFMKLDYLTIRCRPYEPRKFYCKTCGKLGSHTTAFHHEPFVALGAKTPQDP